MQRAKLAVDLFLVSVTLSGLVRIPKTRYRWKCFAILLTPLRCFKQIKRTVSFDVTTRFNAIQQSTAMYNSHIFNGRNTTINVTKRTTINDQLTLLLTNLLT